MSGKDCDLPEETLFLFPQEQALQCGDTLIFTLNAYWCFSGSSLQYVPVIKHFHSVRLEGFFFRQFILLVLSSSLMQRIGCILGFILLYVR